MTTKKCRHEELRSDIAAARRAEEFRSLIATARMTQRVAAQELEVSQRTVEGWLGRTYRTPKMAILAMQWIIKERSKR